MLPTQLLIVTLCKKIRNESGNGEGGDDPRKEVHLVVYQMVNRLPGCLFEGLHFREGALNEECLLGS